MANKKQKQNRIIGFQFPTSDELDDDEDEEELEEGMEYVQPGHVDIFEDDGQGGAVLNLDALKDALGLNDKPAQTPAVNVKVNVGGCCCHCKKCRKKKKNKAE